MREACPDPALLDDLASGRIPPERRPALEAHLDSCAECARVVATLADLFASGMASRDGPSVGYASTLVDPVDRSPRGAGPSGPPPPSLGRYQLGERLGSGGMGVVYVAHDPELDRRVAVKLLHPDTLGNLEHQRARLMREAQAMAKLSHPNVVAVFDVGRVGDQLFLAMELVEGTTLGQWLRAKQRTRVEVIAIFEQAARGLAAAHAVGLVHRDFKPDNVLVGKDGRARVTDFGLARPLGVEARAGVAAALHVPMQTLTAAGALVGTPAYMAPEQLRGEMADARSDQFAFFLALYEALFASRAFVGESLRELAENVLGGRLRPPPPGTPRWLRTLVTRGLSVDPALRHPSMDAVIEELSRDHGRVRRFGLLGAAMIGGAALLVGVMHFATSGSSPKKEIAVSPSTSAGEETACNDVRLEVNEIWTDARKKDVAKAFKDATRYWARDQADRVERVLDGWSKEWVEARKEACRAPKNQSLACLDDRVRMLDALVTELGRADPTTLERAMTASEHLPSPASCNDVNSLARRPAPPAKEAQSKVALVEKELATTWAMIELGHGRDARATADRLVKDAKAIGYEPTLARASWLAGNAALEDGDWKSAVDQMTTAATLAQGSKDGDLSLGIAADLVVMHGAIMDHADDAARWAKVGETEAKREGADAHSIHSLWSAVGAWNLRAGKPREARDAFLKALAVGEERLGKTHGDTAASLADLGNALLALDDREEAEKRARRALKIVQDRFGDEHPLAGSYRKIVGDALLDDGQTEKALVEYKRALKVRSDALHMYDPDYSASIEDVGRTLGALGKLDEAQKELERALGLRQHVMSPDHPDVALSLSSIGDLRILQGRNEEGVAKHREAIAYLEKLVEPDEPRLAEARIALADALVKIGKADASIAPYQAAIAQLTKRFGERSTRVVLARWKLGVALGKKGDATKGLKELDDLTLEVDTLYGFEHRRGGMLARDRAKLALATGDRKRAAELYGVAVHCFTESLGKDHPDTIAAREAQSDAEK